MFVRGNIVSIAFFSLLASGCGDSTGFSGSGDSKPAPDPKPAVTPTSNNTTVAQPVTPASNVPDSAVTAGSFSVWTVPADPAEREDYQIHIQVTLPSNLSSISRNDLTGSISGTDSFFRDLAGEPTTFPLAIFYATHQDSFSSSNNQAKLVVWIPGAAQLVEDTISISSATLAESETLRIVF